MEAVPASQPRSGRSNTISSTDRNSAQRTEEKVVSGQAPILIGLSIYTPGPQQRVSSTGQLAALPTDHQPVRSKTVRYNDPLDLQPEIKVDPNAVRFLPFNDQDWIISFEYESTTFSVKENDPGEDEDDEYTCFIDDVPYDAHSLANALSNPPFLATRWFDHDRPLAYYNAQLIFRKLPTKRSKEAAKWRLMAARRNPKKVPATFRLSSIFEQLKKILDANLFQLSRGNMDGDPRVGYRGLGDIPEARDTTIAQRRSSVNRMEADYSS